MKLTAHHVRIVAEEHRLEITLKDEGDQEEFLRIFLTNTEGIDLELDQDDRRKMTLISRDKWSLKNVLQHLRKNSDLQYDSVWP